MIIGGTIASGSSKKACKTYLRMVQSIQLTGFVPKMAQVDNPMIEFSEENAWRLHHPHDDALVVSIQVRDYNTYQVLIDNGSFADILYYPALQQIRIKQEWLVPTNAPLVEFKGMKVYPLVQSHCPWRLEITLNRLRRMSHSLLLTVHPPIMPSWAIWSLTHGRL